jgi:GT2 family glycosyltransferase
MGTNFARNAGWKRAAAELIAFTDDDARVDHRWLECIVDTFKKHQHEKICVGGRVDPIWEGGPPGWLKGRHFEGALSLLDLGPEPIFLGDGYLWSVNLALPRAALEKVGGFETRLQRQGNLITNDELIILNRVRRLGYQLYYHPDIRVSHLVPKSKLTRYFFVRRYFWQGYSDAVMKNVEENRSEQESKQEARSFATNHLLRRPRVLASLFLPRFTATGMESMCKGYCAVGYLWGLLRFRATDAQGDTRVEKTVGQI